jgi:hypothetical protein
MMPVKPPASTAMFVSVARSSIGIVPRPGPANSSTLPMPREVRKKGWLRMKSITSLALTPSRRRFFSTKRTVSGTFTRTSRVNHALAMSVEPTPKANAPSAPAMQVWLSVPVMTWPG